ncbi:CRISPR-associated endoribonuclease Cas6 [Gallicola sp. Sow4_E12]|uniref:CRISPR-associated endoribonuclease Cas6 n=1 Tax=Gallicola sp. Sow4_E12 TaxID=3438785 RepID=UPI003F93CA06
MLYEYDIKILLLKDINLRDIGEIIGNLLTQVLCSDESWQKKHYDKTYKKYCFNYLYPLAIKDMYTRGGVYNFQCRVMDEKVEKIFDLYLRNFKNDYFKILLTRKKKIIDKNVIEKIYATTPIIIKNNNGYWKNNESFDFYEKRIRENLIKKYNTSTGNNIREAVIFNNLIIDNRKPIAVSYKNITLLGDKATFYIAQDELSQEIVRCALGMGVGENNVTLGSGFVNFKYFRR